MSKLYAQREDRSVTGYCPEDFDRDYWLGAAQAPEVERDGVGERMAPRIARDGRQLAAYWQRIFEACGQPGRVLDVGAGAGRHVHDLREAGFQAEGCEFSDSGRELAQERFGITLAPCDLREKLPYPDDAFDWTSCVGVLSILPRLYVPGAICELLRVTRRGVLVIVLTVAGQPNANPHHLTAMSQLEWWTLFRGAGAHDWTAWGNPSKRDCGLGVSETEFAGLFSKRSQP